MKISASRSMLIRYGIALLAVFVALLLRLLFAYMGTNSVFLFYFGAVIVAAWYGGFGPGIVAVMVSTLLIEYAILFTGDPSILQQPQDQVLLLIFMAEGVLVSVLSAARLRALETLHAERERYAVTMNSIGDGVIATDAQGRLTLINPMAEALTGWPRAEALNQDATRVVQIVQEHSHQPVEHPVVQVLGGGGSGISTDEQVLVARNGSERPIEESSAPIRDERGRLLGAVLVMRDASARRQADTQRHLMAVAGDLLSASLNYQQTLRRVALLAVPKLADLCSIDLVGSDRTVATVAIAYMNQRNQPSLAPPSPIRTPLMADSHDTLQRVIHSGKPLLLGDVSADKLVAHAHQMQFPAVLDHLAPANAIVVPLLARGRILGVMSFVARCGTRQYAQDDVVVAEQLASRAALAVDNARLYAAEQRSRQRAEHVAQRTSKLQAITAALAEASTPVQVADIIVNQGMAVLGATAGVLALLPTPTNGIEILRAVGFEQHVLDFWQHGYASLATPISDALAQGQPVFVTSHDDLADRYPQLSTKQLTRHQAFITLPLVSERHVIGMLQFNFATPQTFDADDKGFVAALAHQCAQSLERARLYEAEQHAQQAMTIAQQRLLFLAEASAVLSASLDYEKTLGSLSRLLVPALADMCFIHMVESDGSLQQLAVAHMDVDKMRLLWEIDRLWPTAKDAPIGAPLVARTLQPELIADVDEAALQAYAPSPGQLAMMRTLEMTSLLAVPLVARERAIGVLTLARTEHHQRYGAEDMTLAEELARRAAVAVDNARLYQEAQEAIRTRDHFLSIASHELKTPLTSLMGYADLLERRSRNSGSFAERELRALRVISDQSRRLNRLVGALLDISRIQSGQLSIERVPFDARHLIVRLVEEVQPSLDNHALACPKMDHPVMILGDEMRLEQVLQNLVQNAVKYSPQGGTIQIRLEHDATHVRIAVQDQGMGIPDDALPHLFSRFYRASNVDPQHISGMGVGLFVVKEIVNLHGGTISVTSKEGTGSTFTISLPLAHEHAMSAISR